MRYLKIGARLTLCAGMGAFLACGNLVSNCLVSPNGLVSWWDGSQVSGLSAIDFVSGVNNGQMSSSITFPSGKNSTAFNFNGSSSVITIPNSSSLPFQGSFTISAWVNSNLHSKQGNRIQTIASSWDYQDNGFTQVSNWQGINISAFPGTASDGVTPWSSFNRFQGSAFDGRYLYFIPYQGGAGGAKIARLDTQMTFTSPSSWQGIDLNLFSGNASDGITPWSSFGGFVGGSFDGRYVYLIPQINGAIARFDSQGNFTSSASWQGVNVAAFPGNATDQVTSWSLFKNYIGSVNDGRYLYLVPSGSGNLARLDTQGTFSTVGAWQGINLTSFSGAASDGVTPWSSFNSLRGGTFDGRYVYFPQRAATGCIAKLDTQGAFASQTSWQGLSIAAFPGNATDGATPWTSFNTFEGAAFDGRYVYFIPNATTSGAFARLDTQSDFTSLASWQGVNIAAFPGLATDGMTAWSAFHGYLGSAFDGKYLYFIPYDTPAAQGKVVRFNTLGSFTSMSSWQGVNIAAFAGNATDGITPWTNFNGFLAGGFDGRYMYLVPGWGAIIGKVARFDTTGPNASFALKYSDSNEDGLGTNSLSASATLIRSANTPITVFTQSDLSSNSWHHLVLTYDSNLLNLYIDGTLGATQLAAGSAQVSSSAFTLGGNTNGQGFFNGMMNDIQIYNRALAATEIQNLFSNRVCK